RGRLVSGEQILVGPTLRLVIESRSVNGTWIVQPLQANQDGQQTTMTVLEKHGKTPLPLYIRRGCESPADRTAYQTIYARYPGSVAAPTAGLHFTDQVFQRLTARGVAWVDLTLHVGPGTFRPVIAERLDDHIMHAEWAELPDEAVATLQSKRQAGGRI